MRYISTRQVVYDITIYSILFWLRTTMQHFTLLCSFYWFFFCLLFCLILLTCSRLIFCLIQYFDKWSMKIDDSKTSLQKNRTFIISTEYVHVDVCMNVRISHLRPFFPYFLSSYIPHLSACDDDCDNKQIIIFCVCCVHECVLTYVSLRLL